MIHVLGISGSLRLNSHNTGLLRAAAEMLPADMTLDIADLAAIPLYNGDLEEGELPAPVQHLIAQVRAADALLIATPEYNYSIPGILKNALDWLSRPISGRPLHNKPLALIGASTGNWGTVRAQLHLHQICVSLNALALNQPTVFIAKAEEKFDSAGNLTDEATRSQVRALLVALQQWTRRVTA